MMFGFVVRSVRHIDARNLYSANVIRFSIVVAADDNAGTAEHLYC